LAILLNQPRGLTVGITWPDAAKNGEALLERQAYLFERQFLKRELSDSASQSDKEAILKRLGEVGRKLQSLDAQ
jgi:hypothetical protein